SRFIRPLSVAGSSVARGSGKHTLPRADCPGRRQHPNRRCTLFTAIVSGDRHLRTVHFSRRVPRQLPCGDPPPYRYLVPGQPVTRVLRQVRLGHLGIGGDHHRSYFLPEVLVRSAKNDALANRRVGLQLLFDLGKVDVLAATQDQVRTPTGYPQPTVVHRSELPAPDPPARGTRGRGRFRVPPVAE